ncbi:hypothetical protein ACFVZ2_09595, partial [Streptomyces lasiicapitis]
GYGKGRAWGAPGRASTFTPLVVDDRELAASMGALATADATLGEVLRDDHPGRTGPTALSVYAPVDLLG